MKKYQQYGIALACVLWAGCNVQVQEPVPDSLPVSVPTRVPTIAPTPIPPPAPTPTPAPEASEPLSAMQDSPIKIIVNPSITRKIGGIAALDRKVYFSVADKGAQLDERSLNPEIYDLLTHELKVRFGRQLGPVNGVTRWGNAVREDPRRKGFVDIAYLRSRLEEEREPPSAQMLKDYGPSLHVAAHGHPMAYPDFMGAYTTEAVKDYNTPQALPENHAASAEYAAAVFKYKFTDFDRPPFFEPINEPHWSFDHEVLADWHMAMLSEFRKARLPVKVGGPCMSVAYMFRNNYRTWDSFSRFMDATDGKLDFYSFHSYDFLEWENEEFVGRLQTGLPVEGTLDMIPNYGLIQFNREVPMVISEHGGYMTGKSGLTPEELEIQLANRFFPGEGFDWMIKKRSILNHQHVHSIVNNTLAFMDHPHTLKKAVPFILLESMAWDPEYHETLYVARDFSDRKDWVESANMDFYRLFRDVDGRRVYINNTDPDLQVQAFASGNTLRVIINNLHRQGAPLQLEMPQAASYALRRYGQHTDYTPYLTEEIIPVIEDLFIRPFEALVLTAVYERPIPQKRTVNETTHYGKRMVVEVKPESTEDILLPLRRQGRIHYADLRIGFRRPAGTDYQMAVSFNGHPLDMPVEDHADRLENDEDYASMRKVRIEPKWIRPENTVSVSFPDGRSGTVGSVVLRTAM